VTVRFGERVVIDRVDLAVRRSEILCIVGESGCGKTTLLKRLAGLVPPTEGTVRLLGRDFFALDDDERDRLRARLGVTFQSGALLSTLTLGENVALPLRERSPLSDDAVRSIVRSKLALVGLADYEHFLPSELSGGMRKRAGVARALALDPEILFFDDPSADLDPVTAAGLDALLLELRKLFGLTLVVVSHQLASVFTIADRIAMLDGGRFAAIGTREDLDRIEDEKIRRFLRRIAPPPEEVEGAGLLDLVAS
jgi:phospholipid/cholesterol/gamma-HCH transport system ATP-binding protein